MLFCKNIIICLLLKAIYCDDNDIDDEYNTDQIPSSDIHRRQDTIPMVYTRGSHYETGFMVGKTFGGVIRDFVDAYGPLEEYLNVYRTADGKRMYRETLKAVDAYFPQYLIELKGTADGAGVPFHKLFLVQLDDVVLPSTPHGAGATTDVAGAGCSTLAVNNPRRGPFIGHTEDALNVTINRFYIISAHIIPSSEELRLNGRFKVREEKWQAMTYAGSLPGYASGHNADGLLFTINTIFAKHLKKGNIPRGFLTRALLASKADLDEIRCVLTNEGVGTADAFHVNVGFLNQNRHGQYLYSIEVCPSSTNEKRSDVIVKVVNTGSTSFHTNRLLYSKHEELRESGWNSSVAREERFRELTFRNPVKSINDILIILGDTEDKKWQIFRDTEDDFVNTINLGIFDFKKKTWKLWTNNPKFNDPIIELPLKFTVFNNPTTAGDKLNGKSFISSVVSTVTDMCIDGLESFKNIFGGKTKI